MHPGGFAFMGRLWGREAQICPCMFARDRDAAPGVPDTNKVSAIALLLQSHRYFATLSRKPSPAVPLPSPVPAEPVPAEHQPMSAAPVP